MGDVADMMLDGTLCAGCGVFLNEEIQGYPCYCDDCQGEGQMPPGQLARQMGFTKDIHKNKKKIKCQHPDCNSWVKEIGLAQHMKDKHQIELDSINLSGKAANEKMLPNVKKKVP